MGNTVGRVIPTSHTSENDAAKIALSLYWTCRTGNHHVAGNLISRGADVNVRHPDSGEGALHAATAHGHFKVIKVLLSHKANPNIRSAAPHDETPLHCAIKTAQNPRCTQWDRSRALQCANLLLQERNIKVDVKDYCGLTPVHIAVQCELWDFAECLITAGANIDILIDGETAREILQRSKPSLLSLIATTKIEPQISIRTKLFDYLKSGKEEKFIKSISSDNSIINTDILQRFIQRASVNGYTKIVKHLIDLGADPYCSGNNSQTPAIVLAAKQGFHETLKVLLESSTPKHAVVDHPLWRRTALHHAAISATDATVETEGSARNLVTCVSLLLKHSRAHHLDINARDFRGNTALQYAAKTYHREIIQLLLRYHSSIFIQNDENIPVFLNIHIKDLEYYFDSQISIKGYTKSDRCHSLTFNYNFLQKPVEQLKQVRKLSLVQNTSDDEDDEDYIRTKQSNTLEMEPLLLLSRSTVHRPLLTHPIVTSFLHLKWQKVKLFFYINFILYLLFTIFISLHIHFLISAHNLPLNETSIEINSTTQNLYEYDKISSHNIIRWLAALFLMWPLSREILEMLMSIRRYFRNVENIMETSLIILAIILLFIETDYYSRQIMSAITILLTYTDLVFLIGRHPKFSIYITMFTRVSRNFLALFFLFSFLIFAFAFSFHIIFYNCLDNDICESRFFSHLGSSIFKTIIMLTGELEAESIKFDLFGYFMFTGFVVFISICLLNLLTGLAVSDITAIREEAEVDSWRAKVKLYAKIESILLGYSIEGINKENWFIRRIQIVASRMFATKIRLLGHLLPENCIEVYLNVDNRMEPDVQARSWRDKLIPKSCIQGQFSSRNQEWDVIVAEAQTIVGSGGVGGTDVVGADTQKIMDRLDVLEAKLTSLLEIIRPNTFNSLSL